MWALYALYEPSKYITKFVEGVFYIPKKFNIQHISKKNNYKV
jgi:hypothetical protein